MRKEFSDILKEYLKNEGINQIQFSERTGFQSGQISEWLSGKVKPGYDNLRKLVISLEVSADYWLGVIDTY